MGKIVFLTKHTVIFLYAVFLLCLGILHENLEAGKIDKKVIVLGLDGMDPVILERMLGQGKLPNFNYLKEKGGFIPLKTSIPPQSPVAWSNFITGMDPGGHGIFDFIHRDPETLNPYLSTSKVEPPNRSISIGNWTFPLSKGKVELLRYGKTFWEILEKHDIPSHVISIPSNFPPVQTPGKSLSGMGTPDILGTYGTFSYFTNNPPENYNEIAGGKVFPVEIMENVIQTKIIGPKNTFRKDAPNATIDLTVYIDPENDVAKLHLQDQEIMLNRGEWSDWIRIKFKLLPLLANTTGICRFFLKEVHPDFKLYVTPINIDPSNPALPVSTPGDYSEELCEAIGFFYTQGMPEDTKALSGNILNDDEYLEQANFVLQDELQMFDYVLKNFQKGLLFFYFSSIDQNCHMFWRTMDKEHPAYDPYASEKHSEVIEKLYIEMDNVVGKAIAACDNNTTLIVMSDHGFAPFYRSFNLNTWLKEEGYTKLFNESSEEKITLFDNVDWNRTKAYGLGLNDLYVNLYGREATGIVMPGKELDSLIDELANKLLQVRDPKTNLNVISKVYKTSEIYHGAHKSDGPDLIVGYSWGHRASWETTLGVFSKEIFSDNTGKWSGDHCMAAEVVPGILLSNKKIRYNTPALYDLTVTILDEFGIEKPNNMIGESIF